MSLILFICLLDLGIRTDHERRNSVSPSKQVLLFHADPHLSDKSPYALEAKTDLMGRSSFQWQTTVIHALLDYFDCLAIGISTLYTAARRAFPFYVIHQEMRVGSHPEHSFLLE